MFSSGSQQGHKGAEGPRQLILGRMFPQALSDRSKVSQKNLPGRMLLPGPQLEAALCLQAGGRRRERGKWTATISLPPPKSLLKGT